MIFDRKTKTYIEEKAFGSSFLNFLYNTYFGTVLLKRIAIKPWFSKVVGLYYGSKFSKIKIKSFVEEYGIGMEVYEEKNYVSFNDFFIRKMKNGQIPEFTDKKALISPCSSKLSVYHIDYDQRFIIKGNTYTLTELLKDDKLADTYRDGICMVFRLTVDDYHRYCFIDDGTMGKIKKITGYLHTVGFISSKHYKVYAENSREYSVLHTANFGDVIQVEIGAILVGKINNKPHIEYFEKGIEKGYFSFGGSTVVLLFKPGMIIIDKDILEASLNNNETKVSIYERIGYKNET